MSEITLYITLFGQEELTCQLSNYVGFSNNIILLRYYYSCLLSRSTSFHCLIICMKSLWKLFAICFKVPFLLWLTWLEIYTWIKIYYSFVTNIGLLLKLRWLRQMLALSFCLNLSQEFFKWCLYFHFLLSLLLYCVYYVSFQLAHVLTL